MKSKKMAELEDDFHEFKALTERRFVSLDMSIRAYRLEEDQRHEERIRRYDELNNLLLSLIHKQASPVKPPSLEATKDLVAEVLFSEDTTKMIDIEKNGEDCGNLEEFMVGSGSEEATITTPIMVVAEELGQKQSQNGQN
ncbi:hypothetical protein Tco_0157771 [Tanacetum coccineum]